MSRVNLIYARAKNFCIGKDGKMPWHLPKEFVWFKKHTMGCPVIMGRKTYEDHKSVLPGRLNIVITRDENYQAVSGIELVSTLDEALKLAFKQKDEVFVIGGVHFFTEAFPMATRVFETVVDTEINGDAFIPEFDFGDWQSELLVASKPDAKNAYGFSVFERRKNTLENSD
ncbi:type 3 dihydrofolate reductase [Sessilibacter sp. MAH1]